MRSLIRATAIAACLAALLPATAAAEPSCPTGGDVASARPAILCLVNAERTSRGLPPLREQPALRAAARRFARRMVRGKVFAHDRRGLIRRIKRAGYMRSHPRWSIGENIAWGQGAAGNAAAIVMAWMNSPPHRRNILNRKFRQIGIGVAAGAPVAGSSGATYVTDFGVRHR
jgi:uncharacterized protein YkwD